MKTKESKCKHEHEHSFCNFDYEEKKEGGRKKNLHSKNNTNNNKFKKWVVQEGVNKFRVEEFFFIIIEASTKFCTNKKTNPKVLGCCH